MSVKTKQTKTELNWDVLLFKEMIYVEYRASIFRENKQITCILNAIF